MSSARFESTKLAVEGTAKNKYPKPTKGDRGSEREAAIDGRRDEIVPKHRRVQEAKSESEPDTNADRDGAAALQTDQSDL